MLRITLKETETASGDRLGESQHDLSSEGVVSVSVEASKHVVSNVLAVCSLSSRIL